MAITPGELMGFLNVDISGVNVLFNDSLSVDIDDEKFREEFEYIRNAPFTGKIVFEFPKNLSFDFTGSLDSTSPHNYNLDITFNIDKKFFNALFDADSEDFIIGFLHNEILNEFEQFDDEAVINSFLLDFSS